MLQRYGTAASQRKTDATAFSRVRNIRGSSPLRGKLRLLALIRAPKRELKRRGWQRQIP